MKTAGPTLPVLSAAVTVADLPPDGHHIVLDADETQRKRLAEAYLLTEVRSLTADLTVERLGADGARVTGRLAAEIEQPCVVTLEPVIQAISEEVAADFTTSVRPRARDQDTPDPDDSQDDDPPETVEGDAIDVGALVEQLFVLAIEPYPRAEGAEIPPEYRPESGRRREESPFSALAALKEGSRGDNAGDEADGAAEPAVSKGAAKD